MTLAEIRTEVREELEEASAELWSEAELNDYINDGFSLIQQATLWKERFTNLPVAASSNNPSGEPADVKQVRRVTFDSELLPEISEYELDRFSTEWRQHSCYRPYRWYYLYGQTTPDNIRTYPCASSDFATDDFSFTQETGEIVQISDNGVLYTFNQETGIVIDLIDDAQAMLQDSNGMALSSITGITADIGDDENALGFWYVAELKELTADADVPDLPSWTHFIPIYYALFRCYEQNGPFQDLNLATAYLKEFIDWVQAATSVRGRQIPHRVFSMDAVTQGFAFENRLSNIEGKNKPRQSI